MSETQAIRRLPDLPRPSNKRKPWRVVGPGEHWEDRASENKAYELVRSLRADGHVVTVYQYEHGRWYLFEHLEAEGELR